MKPTAIGPWNAFLLLISGAMGWVMVWMGLWVVLELPHVLDVSSRWYRTGGAALIAGGIFIFAYCAARCFPRADPRLKLACELTPWIGLVGFVIGGSV